MTKLPLLMLTFAATLASADIAGSWRFNLVSFGEEMFQAKLDLKLDGDKLTGNLNDLKIEGAVQGETLKFTATRPNGKAWGTFEGRLNGSDLSGTLHRDDEDLQWIARRAILPTAAPQTRTFEPTEFHRFFSGTIPPALHINPGELSALQRWMPAVATLRTNAVPTAAIPKPDHSSSKAPCPATR